MSLMNPEAIKAHFGALRDIGASLVKEAGDAKKVHALSGRLYLSSSGWLLLTVPNALVRGAFDSLHVPGVELPLKNGRLVAHISVMDADEVESIGGPTAISERGHQFSFNLGALKEVEPKTWDGVSKVWYLTVDSPELRQLRRSYGLEPLRNGYDHHVTVAIRKTGVLNANEKTKSAGWANSAVYSARLQGHRNAQQLAGDARTLLSEKTSAIQGLRKAWYSCLSSLAPEFSKLSCRHGPATSRDVVGSCEQCEGLLSDELYLGYEKAAESQSAVVSLHTTGRPAVNASRMGGTHGCEVAYDCRENRPVRLDDSASLDNGVKQSAEGPNPLVFLNMLDDVVMYHMARHRMQQARQQAALATPPPPKTAGLAAPATVQPTTDNQKTATALDDLREAKARSDKRDYAGKTHILRRMMKEKPHDWAVDSEDKGIAGLTHMPTKFRLHLPSHHIHDLRRNFGQLQKSSSLLGGLAARAGGSLVTKAMRSSKSPLNPYYASMSRAGLESGFSGGPTIMPRTRWTMSAALGPAAGTVDYEFGNFLGQQARGNLAKLHLPTAPALSDALAVTKSVRPIVTNTPNGPTVDAPYSRRVRRRIRRQMPPLMRQVGQALQPAVHENQAELIANVKSQMHSPLIRNLIDAVASRPTTAATRFAQRNLSSTAAPLMPATQITGAGAVAGGLHGALTGHPVSGALIGGLMSGVTEAPIAMLANAGKTKAISNMKSTLMSRGIREATGQANLTERATNRALGVLDATTGEFISAGGDIERLRRMGQLAPSRVSSGANHIVQHIQEHGSIPATLAALREEAPSLLPRIKRAAELNKEAGRWDVEAPDIVKLPLRGGEQSICPRCHKPIVHDLYRDKKGWTFHRSCFGKGGGAVRMPDSMKEAAAFDYPEEQRGALTTGGDAAAGLGVGLATAGLAAKPLASRTQGLIQQHLPIDPALEARLGAYKKQLDAAKGAPGTLMPAYVQGGHDVLSNPVMPGMSGLDAAKRMHTHPVAKAFGVTPWDQKEQHFTEFAGSPLRGQAQIIRELYGDKADDFAAARFKPDYDRITAEAQRAAKLRGIAPDKWWTDPSLKARFQPALDAVDATRQRALRGRSAFELAGDKAPRMFYDEVWRVSRVYDPKLFASFKQLGVNSSADLEKLPPDVQNKLVKLFASRSEMGQHTSRLFRAVWRNAVPFFGNMAARGQQLTGGLNRTNRALSLMKRYAMPATVVGGGLTLGGLVAGHDGRNADRQQHQNNVEAWRKNLINDTTAQINSQKSWLGRQLGL